MSALFEARDGALADALLVATNLSKRFGGVEALSGTSFEIRQVEIYGLIGPNGAGKTTLFNLLTGIYPPDRGHFAFEGKDLAGLKPDRIAVLAKGVRKHCSIVHLPSPLLA